MDKIEELLQQQVQFLQNQRKLLQNNNNTSSSTDLIDLPFYKTILPLQETCDYQERFLFELEDQIRRRKQEKELHEMHKALASVKQKSLRQNENPLTRWYHEMLEYDRKWVVKSKIDEMPAYQRNRIFFNIRYSKEESSAFNTYSLSFGTRYCGRCLRLNITVKASEDSTNVDEVSFADSLGIDGVDSSYVKEALSESGTAESFVCETVWKGIQTLIDYSLFVN
ncbi:uncharacterized protein LOC143461895 [Clavelina lepadiformis]|uniref:Uncharacterized protein n=1 Tax=Clavelina lepadiformis TaxID=159417 RepID=A0ABP0GLS6_CLALP